jgi:hypothetical protein
MTHTSTPILRVFVVLLLLSSVACKKLPGELPCECDTNPPVYKKGGGPQKLAVCGTLNLPIDTTLNYWFDIIVFVGDYNAHETIPELKLRDSTNFFNEPFMQINAVHWDFSVNATIKDLYGNALLQMMDSKWYVYTNNVGKYNYDAKGLEIFDKQGHIAFSIDSKNPPKDMFNSSLTVQGLFPLPDGTFLFAETIDRNLPLYFSIATPEQKAEFDTAYSHFPIQPLFRYTGPNWQHARL